jgi:hypothetical protein
MENNFNDDDFQKASLCRNCAHCVAVEHNDDIVAVRNTNDKSKLTLLFTKDEWQLFIAGVKQGDFDF